MFFECEFFYLSECRALKKHSRKKKKGSGTHDLANLSAHVLVFNEIMAKKVTEGKDQIAQQCNKNLAYITMKECGLLIAL